LENALANASNIKGNFTDPKWLDQKLNVACRSMRRFAAEFENGPLCSWLDVSKKRDPKMPLGFA
jgi:hypothetical protein